LIHGVFLEEIAGVLRLPRVLSGFIEAEGVSDAESGGVKINRIDATLKDGVGNLPYPKREFVARKITAFFNIDIAQIRGFGLSEDSQRLLLAIALYKVRRFLDVGLKLRSGCDLDLVELKVTRPADYAIPSTEQIAKELPGLIEVAGKSGLFASPSVTEIKWDGRAPGKKKGKTDKGELAGTEEETNS
jgi:CRISPR-associated protein Csb1